MSDFRFFVAMSDKYPDCGVAACVDDDKKIVKEFFREQAGFEIRHVKGDEMKRLLTKYIETRR